MRTIYLETLNGGKVSHKSQDTKEFLYIAVYSADDKIYPITHLYAMKEK